MSNEKEIMMTVKGYSDGVEYAAHVQKRSGRWDTWRVESNVRMVRDEGYTRKDSPTRAYWLGFCRGLRAL